MSVADEYMARFADELAGWDREDEQRPSPQSAHLPQCAQDASALFGALEPIVAIAIKLSADPPSGTTAQSDAAWAAWVARSRRRLLHQTDPTSDGGLTSDGLRLCDRVDALIGDGGQAWGDLVGHSVQELIDSSRRGRQRGRELRRARPIDEPTVGVSRGWLARHPNDHFLRQAVASIQDRECRDLINAQIVRLASSYEQICGLDWSSQETAADTVIEVKILDSHAGSWTQPAHARVTASIKGAPVPGQQLGVRLVQDVATSFNGTRLGLLDGEHWRICATPVTDEGLLPLDGTRRLSAA